jgi:muramoyltetrapeptide carboxypeptidase
MRLPPPLGAGARVALIAPAGPLRGAEELDTALAQARALGWEPVPGEHALGRTGYLAGDDERRLHDLNSALADDTIDGIWCLRGGYGAMRLLRGIDYDAARRRPKAVIGYSDVTALHAALGRESDAVTFHGPTARSALTEMSRDSLLRAVVEQTDSCGVASGARVLRSGRARGRLVGGNLALLASLVGTRYAPDYGGALLVIEDVGEANYRIDRMLRQLELSGALDQIAGIVFGHFTEGSDPSDVSARRLDEVLAEAADFAAVPAIAGAPIGHIADQWTIPLGAMAELDADACALRVLPAPPRGPTNASA